MTERALNCISIGFKICLGFIPNLNSDHFGGPHTAMYGLADVSSVESPDPTMNMEPQKPPKERLTADGQNMRAPTQ